MSGSISCAKDSVAVIMATRRPSPPPPPPLPLPSATEPPSPSPLLLPPPPPPLPSPLREKLMVSVVSLISFSTMEFLALSVKTHRFVAAQAVLSSKV